MNRTWFHGVLAVAIAATGAWCGVCPTAQASSTGLLAVTAQPRGCGWTRIFDPVVANLAFPDTSANYWLALVPNPGPLGSIHLRGRVPDARYFSFNSYDALTSPYDAIADYQIVPLSGRNPFEGPAEVDRSIAAGADYDVQVAFSPAPKARAQNTLYSDQLTKVGSLSLPNPGLALVVYRAYLPRGDATGGAGLPNIELQTALGKRVPVEQGDFCSRLADQVLSGAGVGALDALLVQGGFPVPPVPLPLLGLGASAQPQFGVSYGLTTGLQDRGLGVLALLGSGFAGFFSSANNRYASAMFDRNLGTMYLVRGKAARYVDGPSGPAQLRYWSVCQNEFLTQRVVQCLPDRDLVLDADGYYNVVVTAAADRPAMADAQHAFNWLPWGAYYDGMFIVRNMLPATDFSQAFQNIPHGTDPVSIAGDYFPQATYCDPALFSQLAAAGTTPAQVFAQCHEAR